MLRLKRASALPNSIFRLSSLFFPSRSTMSSNKFALQEADAYINYDTFLASNFDAGQYAHEVVEEAEKGDGTEITTALSTLQFNIESLTSQIQKQVSLNYDVLLSQIIGIKELDSVLLMIQKNIHTLKEALLRLSTKVRPPFEQIQQYTIQLRNLQATSDVLRRLHRFTILCKRLTSQYPVQADTVPDRDLAAAATTLYELGLIMDEADLDGIHLVQNDLTRIRQCRDAIEQEATRLFHQGVDSHSPSKMAASLQIFHNLKMMVPTVQTWVNALLKRLDDKITQTVDMQQLQKEIKSNPAASGPAVRRVNNEPTFGNQIPWANTFWVNMEELMNYMSDSYVKIYNVEKALELKKDSFTHITFLEEVTKSLDTSSLVSYFWHSMSTTFEKELKNASKGSSFLQNSLIGDYPKFLRMLHGFFSRVALHKGASILDYSNSPEYLIMLRSFDTFESGYLARSLSRMYEVVNGIFPSYGGLARTPPGRSDVANMMRTIEKELELTAFEPHLLQKVSRNVVKMVNMFCVKCEALVVTSVQTIYSPSPNMAITNYLNMNIELANVLYSLNQAVWKVIEDYSNDIIDIIRPGTEECQQLMSTIGDNVAESIRADATRILLRIHQEDFSGQLPGQDDMDENSSSQYTKELAKHVRYYHSQILSRFACGTEPKTWVKAIAQHILRVFVFQASLVRPLSEAGKLKLAGDMAEIEFIVSQLLAEYGMRIEEAGAVYKGLRSFRPLLFLDSAQLAAAHHAAGLPPLVQIHHLIVRSQTTSQPLSLPHTVYDLSRQEYMAWMDAQTTKEAVQLAFDALTRNIQDDTRESQEFRAIQAIVENLE
ncbi:Golgi transport complex subunit 5-domain-containing protein [Gongronella butleri]|nr:Golgi transport complex subunit 5-domain-containing protein [Gongronella butleri]